MLQQDRDRDDRDRNPETGKQLTKPKKPKNRQGEKFDRAKLGKAWGELPPYLQEVFKKGGSPEVPSKYKSFEEEYHKKADRQKRRK